ncbi:DUF4124 domain-containing protein [Pseudoxanthomonas sp. 22568]|uniref:DUF4124 domain-containing protein n=1 Tax=Pseudoxanthomonas TaxID=83618 RepID=UPI00193AFA09|nr:DUF4124 domain-containing protein [Pseudoxanthomonas beigongshangi]
MSYRLAWLMLLAAPAAHADEVVIYRCTDAAGALTVQNMPCPKGSRQQVKRMPALATVPMAPAASTPAAAPPATPAAAPEPAVPAAATAPAESTPVATAAHLPPPNLFRCTTRDGGGYLTEDSEPASRCEPLQTIGLDGNPQGGAGQACEVVRDTCARVPDEGLCEAWKKRRDEAEVAWRFTRTETSEKNKAEFERVQRILAESTCGG